MSNKPLCYQHNSSNFGFKTVVFLKQESGMIIKCTPVSINLFWKLIVLNQTFLQQYYDGEKLRKYIFRVSKNEQDL